MKFTDGMWMTKAGFTVETPAEIYEVKEENGGLTLYCPYVAVQHRGNTLDGGLLEKLHERGLKVCVWINPYIAQKSPLFAEGLAKGFFVHTGDGGVWQWDRWQAGMALVDFTNPDAVRWYQEKLAALVDMGVDCFKTDFGERIPTADPFYGPKAARYGIRWFDGSDPEGMHNYYTYLYNKAVFDLLEEKKGKGEACLFARSATACSQTLPLHWGGDCLLAAKAVWLSRPL